MSVMVPTTALVVVLIRVTELPSRLVTYTCDPSWDTVIPYGARPTPIADPTTVLVVVLIRETVLLPEFATHNVDPLSANALGVHPTGVFATTALVVVLIRETVLDDALATHTDVPSALASIAVGEPPTGMVLTTAPVTGSNTDTVVDPVVATYTPLPGITTTPEGFDPDPVAQDTGALTVLGNSETFTCTDVDATPSLATTVKTSVSAPGVWPARSRPAWVGV